MSRPCRRSASSRSRVVLQHIVPNVAAPYIIMLTAQLGGAILAEAALKDLVLGAGEPTPSSGLMLSGSAPSYAEKAPWIALFPGIAISLGVFGFNLFGDSLRDALDRSCGGAEPGAGRASRLARGLRRGHSQIRLPDAGFVPQRRRRALGHDPALLEHVGAVGDLQRPGHVLLDEQDGHALGVDGADDLEHVVHHRRRQAERRLVQQQQARAAP